MPNEILEEIYQVRDEHARECAYNLEEMFAHMSEHLKELQSEGWRVSSPDQPSLATAMPEAHTEKAGF